MPETLFFFFAALTLVAALFVIASRNPVNSAMAMILALLGIAANFFLLQAPFLGVMQILVYAGAVMVLFIFVITLFDVSRMSARRFSWLTFATGGAVLVLVGGSLLCLVWAPGNLPAPPPRPVPLQNVAGTPAARAANVVNLPPAVRGEPSAAAAPAHAATAPTSPVIAASFASGAKAYGHLLFGKYMLPTLATAFLLLAAMLGVFLLVGKRPANGAPSASLEKP